MEPFGSININIGAFQVGPVVYNRIGRYTTSNTVGSKGDRISNTEGFTNIEKTYPPIPLTVTVVDEYYQVGPYNIGAGGGRTGMFNHWENMKFRYLGPNSNLAHYTIQDSINNNIGIQHNQEVMKLTCDTVAYHNGEPYTSTYTRPYIINGVNQNADITYYVQDCTATYA